MGKIYVRFFLPTFIACLCVIGFAFLLQAQAGDNPSVAYQNTVVILATAGAGGAAQTISLAVLHTLKNRRDSR